MDVVVTYGDVRRVDFTNNRRSSSPREFCKCAIARCRATYVCKCEGGEGRWSLAQKNVRTPTQRVARIDPERSVTKPWRQRESKRPRLGDLLYLLCLNSACQRLGWIEAEGERRRAPTLQKSGRKCRKEVVSGRSQAYAHVVCMLAPSRQVANIVSPVLYSFPIRVDRTNTTVKFG